MSTVGICQWCGENTEVFSTTMDFIKESIEVFFCQECLDTYATSCKACGETFVSIQDKPLCGACESKIEKEILSIYFLGGEGVDVEERKDGSVEITGSIEYGGGVYSSYGEVLSTLKEVRELMEKGYK